VEKNGNKQIRETGGGGMIKQGDFYLCKECRKTCYYDEDVKKYPYCKKCKKDFTKQGDGRMKILWGMFFIMVSIWMIDAITTINLIFTRDGFREVSEVPKWLFTFGALGLVAWIFLVISFLFLVCLFFQWSFNLILNHPKVKGSKKERAFQGIISFLIIVILFFFFKSELGAIVNNVSLIVGI
jgi:hypothetical protein